MESFWEYKNYTHYHQIYLRNCLERNKNGKKETWPFNFMRRDTRTEDNNSLIPPSHVTIGSSVQMWEFIYAARAKWKKPNMPLLWKKSPHEHEF